MTTQTAPFPSSIPRPRLHILEHLVWRRRSPTAARSVASVIRTWMVLNITSRTRRHAILTSSLLQAGTWLLVEASCKGRTSTLLGLAYLASVKRVFYKVPISRTTCNSILRIIIPTLIRRRFLRASSRGIRFNDRFGGLELMVWTSCQSRFGTTVLWSGNKSVLSRLWRRSSTTH